jgi:hypothetical protein
MQEDQQVVQVEIVFYLVEEFQQLLLMVEVVEELGILLVMEFLVVQEEVVL